MSSQVYYSFPVFDPNATHEQFTEAVRDDVDNAVLQLYEIFCDGVCIDVTFTMTKDSSLRGLIINPGGNYTGKDGFLLSELLLILM